MVLSSSKFRVAFFELEPVSPVLAVLEVLGVFAVFAVFAVADGSGAAPAGVG